MNETKLNKEGSIRSVAGTGAAVDSSGVTAGRGREAGPPVLELRGVRKSYGAVLALKGVDFTIRAGEVHAIVGENGAGKSTLIGVASGILTCNAGSILCGAETVTAPNPPSSPPPMRSFWTLPP